MKKDLPNDLKIPKLPWGERFTAFGASLALFLILVVVSIPALEGAGRDLDYLTNLRRFAGQFFPPDWSAAPQILDALGETVQIAVMATFFAVILALPLAIAGAQNIAPRWLNLVTRMILNAVRTLPSLIWALLAVAVVGPNSLAGVIGLTFYSLGYLGKFFSDAFESVDTEISDGLRRIGADRIQAFQYGLLPQVKPLILSHALWMLEYNIRSAAIIGYVGAGGIGLLLHTFQEYGQWQKFSTVLIFILALVTALDFFGEWLRGKLTKND
ncbi:MAG TPA: phosphonate ABC transporter, permease protein PhnE [Pyrinomonadaceae bacterium]|nr:phosphonate ABC transporter, permease protein PhnE [Pyrinomonadaceae bacterium]